MANLSSRGKPFVVLHQTPGQGTPSSNKAESIPDNPKRTSISPILSNSSYFTVDGSLLSREVDNWIQGWDYQTSDVTNVSQIRRATAQRPTPITDQTSQYTSRFYQALFMVVPMLLARHRARWSRSPANILAAFESVFSYLGAAYNKIYVQFQRLYSEQAVQNLLSIAWDLIVIIYSIGFLVISVYESSVTE